MEAKKLKTFLEMVSVNKKQVELELKKIENGVQVNVLTKDNTTMIKGILKGLNISENLIVKDVATLMDALDYTKGTPTIEKKENRLFISSKVNGKVKYKEIGLMDPDAFTKAPDFKELEFEDGFLKLSHGDLLDISSQFSKLKADMIKLVVKDNLLKIETMNETDVAGIEIPVTFKDCKAMYGLPISEVIDSITHEGLIEVYLKVNVPDPAKGFPIVMAFETDDWKIKYLIAPRTEDKSEVKEAPKEKIKEEKKVE